MPFLQPILCAFPKQVATLLSPCSALATRVFDSQQKSCKPAVSMQNGNV
jgi:hypothetical protein